MMWLWAVLYYSTQVCVILHAHKLWSLTGKQSLQCGQLDYATNMCHACTAVQPVYLNINGVFTQHP